MNPLCVQLIHILVYFIILVLSSDVVVTYVYVCLPVLYNILTNYLYTCFTYENELSNDNATVKQLSCHALCLYPLCTCVVDISTYTYFKLLVSLYSL